MIAGVLQKYLMNRGAINIKAKVSDIDFNQISKEDRMQFSLYSKRRMRFCLLFGGICSPLSFMLANEIATTYQLSFFKCVIATVILYVSLASAPWWIYYAGKPKGIRYGRISAKNAERAGQYRGYNYNVYFEDIHKSLMHVRISTIVPGHHYKHLKVKDPVKVVKCWTGKIVIMR
ncbi:hypothetical protein [Anaerosporobacter faecicola]|uniref:hypothetical protein n=1 Tax=Anaerosporobacter faecicola TaxID=2718714 RepID=UPI00143B1A17|nr:hypothetical protein [Anaerosporobacter faecicola]